MYEGDDFDLAGFVVGAAERGQSPRSRPHASRRCPHRARPSGVHSNGIPCARSWKSRPGLERCSAVRTRQTLGEALLAPTRLYVKSCLPLIKSGLANGLAHITGGGLVENPPRMTPDHLVPVIDYTVSTCRRCSSGSRKQAVSPARKCTDIQLRHRHADRRTLQQTPMRQSRNLQKPARPA